jgi:hypothetical protein
VITLDHRSITAIFKEMKDTGVKLNIDILNAWLKLYVRSLDDKAAETIFLYIHQHSQHPQQQN